METTPRINVILVWFWRFAGNLMQSLQVGKLFHVRAAAVGNARSPTVDSSTRLLHQHQQLRLQQDDKKYITEDGKPVQ